MGVKKHFRDGNFVGYNYVPAEEGVNEGGLHLYTMTMHSYSKEVRLNRAHSLVIMLLCVASNFIVMTKHISRFNAPQC